MILDNHCHFLDNGLHFLDNKLSAERRKSFAKNENPARL